MKYKLSQMNKNFSLFNDDNFVKRVLDNIPLDERIFSEVKELKIFPVFVSENFFKTKNNNVHFIGDAFCFFTIICSKTSSLLRCYELFKSIENNTERIFLKKESTKLK